MRPVEVLHYVCEHHKEVLDFVQENCPRVLNDNVGIITTTAAFITLRDKVKNAFDANPTVYGFVLDMLYFENLGQSVNDAAFGLIKEMTEAGKTIEEIQLAGDKLYSKPS